MTFLSLQCEKCKVNFVNAYVNNILTLCDKNVNIYLVVEIF